MYTCVCVRASLGRHRHGGCPQAYSDAKRRKKKKKGLHVTLLRLLFASFVAQQAELSSWCSHGLVVLCDDDDDDDDDYVRTDIREQLWRCCVQA